MERLELKFGDCNTRLLILSLVIVKLLQDGLSIWIPQFGMYGPIAAQLEASEPVQSFLLFQEFTGFYQNVDDLPLAYDFLVQFDVQFVRDLIFMSAK